MNWHRCKRTLPRGGNYQLRHHLPIFMWKVRCSQQNMDPFTHLLQLLADPKYAATEIEDEPDTGNDEVPDFPCLYCPKEYRNEKFLKRHMAKCKTAEQPEPENLEPPEMFPCAYCPESFTDKKKMKKHMAKCLLEEFPCQVCGKIFHSTYLLAKHSAKCKPNGQVTQLLCSDIITYAYLLYLGPCRRIALSLWDWKLRQILCNKAGTNHAHEKMQTFWLILSYFNIWHFI